MQPVRHIRRVFDRAAQFPHDRVAREPQFPQNPADHPHNFRQPIRRDNYQRDYQYQKYFDDAQGIFTSELLYNHREPIRGCQRCVKQ